MTSKYMLVGAVVASACISFITPAHSIPVGPDPTDFAIAESPGIYTIINNSADWYIISIAVSNPDAASGGGSTTQPNWQTQITTVDGVVPAYGYYDPLSHVSGGDVFVDPIVGLSNDIGPGTSSNRFTFTGALPSGHYAMLVVTSDDRFGTVQGETSSLSPVPGPIVGAGLPGPPVGERWPSRLVATPHGEKRMKALALGGVAATLVISPAWS